MYPATIGHLQRNLIAFGNIVSQTFQKIVVDNKKTAGSLLFNKPPAGKSGCGSKKTLSDLFTGHNKGRRHTKVFAIEQDVPVERLEGELAIPVHLGLLQQ